MLMTFAVTIKWHIVTNDTEKVLGRKATDFSTCVKEAVKAEFGTPSMLKFSFMNYFKIVLTGVFVPVFLFLFQVFLFNKQ